MQGWKFIPRRDVELAPMELTARVGRPQGQEDSVRPRPSLWGMEEAPGGVLRSDLGLIASLWLLY